MSFIFNKTSVSLEINSPEPWLPICGQTKERWLLSALAGGFFPSSTALIIVIPATMTCWGMTLSMEISKDAI